ncbi:MAG: hypothetical protein DWP92_00755 [Armatimonadetes bacterium]|nr:MAG: hypothetical protein DWP92_00755 [Armatimonadota bacterium]
MGGVEVPDGIWFGFIKAIDTSTVTIDVACFWTGEAANSRAIADGEEPLDFYIRNNNLSTRSAPLNDTGTAYWLDGAGDLTPIAIPMADWPSTSSTAIQDCPSDHCAAWIYVNGGTVTELVEQYLP